MKARDLVMARRQGYLVTPRQQLSSYNRWYAYCRQQRQPFIAVQGGSYVQITVDLLPARRAWRPTAHDVLLAAWRAARQGYRGGSMAMSGDRLDVYRLPMTGVKSFMRVLVDVVRTMTDLEPFLKEHMRGIIARCREAGFPLQLVSDGKGRGVTCVTVALPPDLLVEVERDAPFITEVLMTAPELSA